MLLRGPALFFLLLRMWRYLPASQKRKVLQFAGRYAPILFGAAAKRAMRRRGRWQR